MAFLGLATKEQKAVKRETARSIVSPGSDLKVDKSDSPEQAALKIKTSIITVDSLLKDRLVLSKVKQGIERQNKEKAKRDDQENKLETPKASGGGKLVIPGAKKVQSLWQKLRDFFVKLFWGWVVVRLIDLAPLISKVLPWIGKFVDFGLWLGGKVFKGFVWAVDKAYGLYDGLREKIKDMWGENALKVFDDLATKFKKFANIAAVAATAILTLVAIRTLMMATNKAKACLVCAGGGGPGSRMGLGRSLKRILRRVRNPGRTLQATRRLMRKGLSSNIRRVQQATQSLNPFRAKPRPPATQQLSLFDDVADVTKPKPSSAATVIDDVADVSKPKPKPKPPKPTVKPKPPSATTVIDDAAKKVKPKGNVFSNILKWGKNKWTKWSTAALDSFGGMISGAKAWGAKQAERLGDVAQLVKDPKKLQEVMKSKLTKQIDDIIKNNKFLKNLMPMLKDPKKLREGLKAFITSAGKSKGITSVKSILERAKAVKPKIGGIDAVIAGIVALIDYTITGEAPINTLVKALSGLLGYAAGFAIGAPFGGMPGFITGMAGSMIGEWLGMKFLQGLVKGFPGLTTTPDPIANDGRMLLRDPKGPVDHMVKQPEKTYTHRFDEMEGTFINDVRVSLEEYNKFISLSEEERLKLYGKPSAVENKLKIANEQGGAQGVIDSISTTAPYEKPVVVEEGSGGGIEVISVNEVTPSKVVPVSTGGPSKNDGAFDINYMGG